MAVKGGINLFRELRRMSGLNQRDCARRLGIGETLMYRLERNPADVRSAKAARVRRAIYRAGLQELAIIRSAR